MAFVKMVKPEKTDDLVVREIFVWVGQMEGAVDGRAGCAK